MTGEHLNRSMLVDTVILAAAPERKEDLQKLWAKCDPEVLIYPDESGIMLQAKGGRIEFSNRYMRATWLLGYCAWSALESYSPTLLFSSHVGLGVSDVLEQDDGFSDIRNRLEVLLDASRAIREGLDFWPDHVPQPQVDQQGLDPQQKVVFQITMIGTAYALLHEVGHLLSESADEDDISEEEIKCDVFARSFLTDKIGKYAEASGQDYAAITSLRAMGIALGAFVLGETTPSDAYAGAIDYPPLLQRLRALLLGMPLPENDKFWIFGSALLITLARLHEMALVSLDGTPKQVLERILEDLETRWCS